MFFDNKFSEDSVQKLLAYLEEGFYISTNTSLIEVELLMYNPNVEMYTLVLVKFTFEEAGTLAVEDVVKIFPARRYTEDGWGRVVMEGIFVILFLFQIVIEIYELRKLGDEWPEYFLDVSNLLDITGLGQSI